MSSAQSPGEIDDLLASRLIGRSVRQLQVLGVNALKTVMPSADELAGQQVRDARCEERVITILTETYEMRVDLQRTGRVTWLKNADTWQLSSGVPLPTVRLLLDNGTGLDFTEPAKTKRVTVTLASASA